VQRVEGKLSNNHFEYFYAEHFGLKNDFYTDKVILDIGCGPRGSLEWASMSARRIGLDPLAGEYLKLGASRHAMEYMAAPSEAIPLPDAACDAVFSFNSLDHVEDVEKTLREVKRVTRPGGVFLLLVEVNHPPTYCEPHELTPRGLLQAVGPEFACEQLDVYAPRVTGIYQSIMAGSRLAYPETTREKGYLSAKFLRVSDSGRRSQFPLEC